ncbi:hypothetical protein CCS01_20885 [Rhodopila globiformis]|uniref:Uncharacterized protein n=1 Tax=Rhodopila globiformis TaxID=1071 RepID=A0A2S6N4W9_RHOGL|nr:hypothetical protein CCS01_20885 [Rhodopila globiformis]
MTSYEIVSEQGFIIDAWAVVAVGLDGQRRYVSRYMTLAQAQKTMAWLGAMMAAGSLRPATASAPC